MRRLFPCPARSWALPALAACITVSTAGAAIIHVDLAATPIAIPGGIDGVYLNLVTGTSSTASVPPAGWDFNPFRGAADLSFFGPDFPNGQGTLVSGAIALALLGGETIGSGGLYQTGTALGTNFQITGISFAGLRFYNESTSQTNYAWAKLSTTAATGFPASILGYAYDDTGGPITAGAIPEPTAAGLLALSGIALLARRKGSQESTPFV